MGRVSSAGLQGLEHRHTLLSRSRRRCVPVRSPLLDSSGVPFHLGPCGMFTVTPKTVEPLLC